MENKPDSKQTQLSAACLLLSVAEADEILEQKEVDTVSDILLEFFNLSEKEVKLLIAEAQKDLKNSTGLFQYGRQIASDFDYNDKLDFITCIFEVAYADEELHYLEHHTIKKIANFFNLNRGDIIAAKAEIETYLD